MLCSIKRSVLVNDTIESELKQTFPLKNGNFIISGLTELQRRPFYDTEWQVEGVDETGTSFSLKITRYDYESFLNIYELIKRPDQLSQLKDLDVKNKIWYD